MHHVVMFYSMDISTHQVSTTDVKLLDDPITTVSGFNFFKLSSLKTLCSTVIKNGKTTSILLKIPFSIEINTCNWIYNSQGRKKNIKTFKRPPYILSTCTEYFLTHPKNLFILIQNRHYLLHQQRKRDIPLLLLIW